LRIWLPDVSAPLAHNVVFSMWKRPVSWKRASPGVSKTGKLYMRKNDKDRRHQEEILRAFTRKVGELGIAADFPWGGPVSCQIYNYFSTPTAHWEGKERISRPDVDNLAKQVLDALMPKGKGGWGAYVDDAQVIDLSTSKRYDGRGDIITVQLLFWYLIPKPIRRLKGVTL